LPGDGVAGAAGAAGAATAAGQLAGRRIWFAGIGGAGMSALAVVARAWGAEVAGWDRNDTPYLAPLVGVAVTIAPEPPAPPAGFEVVVSTAYAGLVDGSSRGAFLAELVSLRPSIVVAGAHGKTTTSSMIAFTLAELGRDPSYLIGGMVPQLGGNAGAGEGWLVAEGDESDRTLELLAPRVAVVTNSDLDHHTTFASLAEVEELFEAWLARAPHAIRGASLEPVDFALAVPGDHNRRNAATALAALAAAGVSRQEAAPVLARFRGVGRRFERKGEVRGITVVDDYGHHPTEVAATIAAARGAGFTRVLVLFQPHLFSRTLHLQHEFARALAAADAVAVADIYAAREQPVPGVTGKLVVDALAVRRPGMPIGWMPALADGARYLAALARPGDVVLTVGAGDVETAGDLLLTELA
jgi:UDP-N-acetylmuramate--alanine ligase